MNDLRKEVGMQCCLRGRLVRSRMICIKDIGKGKATAEMGGLCEEEYEKIGRERKGLLIENYGNKVQKHWLHNTVPDPHPCTAGNKEEDTVPDPHPCTAGNMEEELIVTLETCLV